MDARHALGTAGHLQHDLCVSPSCAVRQAPQAHRRHAMPTTVASCVTGGFASTAAAAAERQRRHPFSLNNLCNAQQTWDLTQGVHTDVVDNTPQ